MVKESSTSIQAYAKKINADYKLITTRKYPKYNITVEKLQALEYIEYDKVVMMDCDVFAIGDENIFDQFNHFAGVQWQSLTNIPKINGGVVCYSSDFILEWYTWIQNRIKQLKELKSDYLWAYTDEKVLSALIRMTDVEVLDPKWNWFDRPLEEGVQLWHKKS
jgi:alpha-N-acetylglucosamine transferase